MGHAEEPSAPALAASTVLLVDDDAEIRRLYARALEGAGHACLTAGSSMAALELLRDHAETEVVVTDIRMPEEDGIVFLRHVREDFADRPWLQVLLISGDPSLDAAIGGLRLQARDLLQKPVRPKDLVAAVDHAAATARSHRDQTRQHETARATIARLVAQFDEALEQFTATGRAEDTPPVPGAGSGQRPVPPRGTEEAGITVEKIERLIRWQRDRNRLFRERYFSDPAWYMLLDLYHGEVTGRETSVTSLCLASDVPVTTALRRIDELEHDGVLRREPDAADRRRINVALQPEARQRMTECLAGLLEAMDHDRPGA